MLARYVERVSASLVPDSATLMNASADVQRAAERLERLFAFAEVERAGRAEAVSTPRDADVPAWRRWLDAVILWR